MRKHASRVGAVASTLCYGQWLLSIGNDHLQHLAEHKPFERSKQKFEKLKTSVGPLSRPKFTMVSRGVAAPHVGEIYGWRSFSGDFSGKRPAGPERSSPTHYTSMGVVPAHDVSFGGLIDTSHPMGSYPRKTPYFEAVNGDSQLKSLRAYLGTGE
jgi:hypothetical protein